MIVPPAENRTDLGNARRLVRHFGERVRYVHLWKKWLVYADGLWRVDDSGELKRLAKETATRIYAEALASASDADRHELMR
jgi:putative DNA primase/helicase